MYDLELAGDVDPIPLFATVVLVDRSRRLKLGDIFGGPQSEVDRFAHLFRMLGHELEDFRASPVCNP